MIIQRDNESWWIAVWSHRADEWAATLVLRIKVVIHNVLNNLQ